VRECARVEAAMRSLLIVARVRSSDTSAECECALRALVVASVCRCVGVSVCRWDDGRHSGGGYDRPLPLLAPRSGIRRSDSRTSARHRDIVHAHT
jgi:hypothetical protein